MRAGAADGADVDAVLQVGEHVGAQVDDGDVVVLGSEVVRDRAADLAGTEDQDLHDVLTESSRTHDGAGLLRARLSFVLGRALRVDAEGAQLAVQVRALHADLLGEARRCRRILELLQ